MAEKYILKSEGEAGNLKFERYAIMPNGSNTPRILTLVGELHIYSKEESELGKQLIAENDILTKSFGGKAVYAYEDTKQTFSEMKANDLIFTGLVGLCQAPDFLTAMIFSGRGHKTIEQLLADKGNQMKPLEKNFAAYMTSGQKLYYLLFEGYLNLLLFPFVAGYSISYYKRYNYKGTQKKGSSSYISLIEKRDEEMANNIIKYLTEEGTSTVLAVVGRAHLEGVVQNLKKDPRIKIEKMEDIEAD